MPKENESRLEATNPNSRLLLKLIPLRAQPLKTPVIIACHFLILNLCAETQSTAFLNPHTVDGRVLLGELNCVSCHSAGGQAQTFPIKDAPRLTEIGARVSPQYLLKFLMNPQELKPGTAMPDLLHGLPPEKKIEVVQDLVHFLVSLGGPLDGVDQEFVAKQIDLGEKLYHTVGCVACHQPFQPAAGFQPKGTDIAEAMKSMPKLEQPSIPLGDLASKTTVSGLASFLQDPLDTREGGRMPSLNLNADEADAIAIYLLQKQKPEKPVTGTGLLYQVFSDSKKTKLISKGRASAISLENLDLPKDSTVEFKGLIEVEEGEYSFFMGADGLYSLTIDNKSVINGNFKKGGQQTLGERVTFKKGHHLILVQVSRDNESKRLDLTWEGPGILEPGPIPAGALSHTSRPWNPTAYTPLQPDVERVARGQELFRTIGCASCHNTGSHLKRSYVGKDLVDPRLKVEKFATKNNRSPGHEDVQHAIDGNTKTKYLNFGKEGSGLVIHLAKSPVVISGIKFTSANDSPERDPIRYRLEGSNDGKLFDLIDESDIPDFTGRHQSHSLSFANDSAFKTYRITFVKIRDAQKAECVQIAEVRLFGSQKKLEGLKSDFNARPLIDLTSEAAGGCLDSAVDAGRPKFALSKLQLDALKLTITSLKDLNAPSPAERMAHHLSTFNCYACHDRDGKGGPEEGRRLYFTTPIPVDLGDEGRMPPSLDLVGAKLTETGLGQVLFSGHVNRPYMSTRMPQFGRPNLKQLPDLLAKADAGKLPGHNPVSSGGRTVSEGRKLVGNKAYGCINCHSWGSNKSLGTPGPNLTEVTRRISPDWFRAWLTNPYEMRQGTRMPNFFPEGKGALTEVLNGDATRQIDAIWAYLSRGESATPPEGMKPGDPYVLIPEEDPVLFRAFVSGIGAQAITIGFPSGVHTAFDALRCQLAMAWTGTFISAQSSWTGRGGRYTGIDSSDKISMPTGPAMALLEASDAPWPQYDAKEWHFAGYRYDKARNPILRYQFKGIHVEEMLSSQFDERASLKRTLQLSSDKEVKNLMFRTGSGKEIKKENEVHVVDGKLRFSLGSDAVVRKTAEGQELIVPVTFEAKDGVYVANLEFVLEW